MIRTVGGLRRKRRVVLAERCCMMAGLREWWNGRRSRLKIDRPLGMGVRVPPLAPRRLTVWNDGGSVGWPHAAYAAGSLRIPRLLRSPEPEKLGDDRRDVGFRDRRL